MSASVNPGSGLAQEATALTTTAGIDEQAVLQDAVAVDGSLQDRAHRTVLAFVVGPGHDRQRR